MESKDILNRLEKIGVKTDDLKLINDAYHQPHRYYHNWKHILKMIEIAEKKAILDDSLFLAIVFHDIVYNPKNNDNEEKSVDCFLYAVPSSIPNRQSICDAIISTKEHKWQYQRLGHDLILLDLEIFNSSFDDLVQFEKDIFKEYQFVDWKIYKEKRMKILERFNATESHKNYLKYFEPKIGVFAGSFNPFHVGHLNILEKAERIFDKVIIASGLNPEKTSVKEPLPKTIQNRQIEHYNGLLTDFLKGLQYPITLIRGLRDANDLLYESNQICFLKEFMPELNIIEILCDKEFNHISSSAIRALKSYNVADKYLLT